MPAVGIVCLALVASISGITNQFAQDEFGLILKNASVHDLSHGLRFFAEPYWPAPLPPELYRPLALLTYAVQWAAGGGGPMVFRVVSYLLYAGASLAMFRLARVALPAAASFAAAALFAVHPVHVEAVALAVNQGELWVALLSCLAVFRYVEARRAGPLRLSTTLEIGALYLVACFFKENAVILPGLLIAAERFLIPGDGSLSGRVRAVRPLYLILLLVGLTFLAIRTAVLGGEVRGTEIAVTIEPQNMVGRALTMLTVVPHWARLLLWPAHLQGDYSPSEIVARYVWVPDDTLGVLLIVGVAAAAIAARRRAPAISFGIAWMAIALFPVHNVLVPTGIVLAERTLLLASVGSMIALGGLGELIRRRAVPRARRALALVVGLLLILGVYRSATRHPVWSDMFNYWYVTANHDAPLSFQAHHALGEMYLLAGAEGRAEPEFRLAIALAPPNESNVYLAYANLLRLRGFCHPAAELYRKSLGVNPAGDEVRASLVACLIELGNYPEALREIPIGLSYGGETRTWLRLQQAADSALKAGAPPGSIRLTEQGVPRR